VLLVLPEAETKTSTAAMYERFDERGGANGFEQRRAALVDALSRVEHARDLAHFPPNDLATSPLAAELRARGAFRADVTGAGPAVYGLFEDEPAAGEAAGSLAGQGRVWLTRPRMAR
jgi:4-diphosphocytidyl-2C-methyl-D-erythritol kinase